MTRTLLIGQSGGPTSVINATVYGAVREAQLQGMRVLGMYHGIEGVLKSEYVDFSDVPHDEFEKLPHTPGAWLGTCRYKLKDGDIPRILDAATNYPFGADALFYIGGNDSADTSNQLAQAANGKLLVIGGNKTMDNDLVRTHFCNGYPSAARYLIDLVRAQARDASSMPPRNEIVLIEALGRDAGWVTGAAVLAAEPHGPRMLTYLPERPISVDYVLSDVEHALNDSGLAVVVMSEGLRDMSGELYAGSNKTDAFGHVQHGDRTVTDMFTQVFASRGYKVRKIQPGTYVRAAMQLVSDIDRASAEAAGRYAVQALGEGKSGFMVTNRAPVYVQPDGPHAVVSGDRPAYVPFDLTPLERIANNVRPVPDEWINSESNGVTGEFADYLRPLIGPLPEFARPAPVRNARTFPVLELVAAGG